MAMSVRLSKDRKNVEVISPDGKVLDSLDMAATEQMFGVADALVRQRNEAELAKIRAETNYYNRRGGRGSGGGGGGRGSGGFGLASLKLTEEKANQMFADHDSLTPEEFAVKYPGVIPGKTSITIGNENVPRVFGAPNNAGSGAGSNKQRVDLTGTGNPNSSTPPAAANPPPIVPSAGMEQPLPEKPKGDVWVPAEERMEKMKHDKEMERMGLKLPKEDIERRRNMEAEKKARERAEADQKWKEKEANRPRKHFSILTDVPESPTLGILRNR
jgi:hypothetical protein